MIRRPQTLSHGRNIGVCAVMEFLIKVLSELDEIFGYPIRGEVGRTRPHFFMDRQRSHGIQFPFLGRILSRIGDFGLCAIFRPLNRIPSPSDNQADLPLD